MKQWKQYANQPFRGTFYCLCSILNGRSRYIVNRDLRESMTAADIEIILERSRSITQPQDFRPTRVSARPLQASSHA